MQLLNPKTMVEIGYNDNQIINSND